MHWRLVSIFLLFQQAFWLLVLLPGHQRGAMVVAGSESCCATRNDSACDVSGMPAQEPTHDEQPGDRASRCAVCFVAVRMIAPTVVDLTPPPLRLLEVLPPEVPSERPALEISPTYLACGPPRA